MQQMKKIKNKIIIGGIYLSVFIAGFIVSKAVDFQYFEISKNIDIVNILSLIITVWLAILITTIFEKRNGDYRIEKDLIINRIGNIFDIASTLQVESITGKIAFTEAASSIKRINTSLCSIYKIVSKCHFDISDPIQHKLSSNLTELREALTNTPRLSEEQINATNLPIEIRDGMIYYNRDRISQIEVKFDNLKDILLELQIDINGK